MLCVAIFSFVIVMRSIAIMKGGGGFRYIHCSKTCQFYSGHIFFKSVHVES